MRLGVHAIVASIGYDALVIVNQRLGLEGVISLACSPSPAS